MVALFFLTSTTTCLPACLPPRTTPLPWLPIPTLYLTSLKATLFSRTKLKKLHAYILFHETGCRQTFPSSPDSHHGLSIETPCYLPTSIIKIITLVCSKIFAKTCSKIFFTWKLALALALALVSKTCSCSKMLFLEKLAHFSYLNLTCSYSYSSLTLPLFLSLSLKIFHFFNIWQQISRRMDNASRAWLNAQRSRATWRRAALVNGASCALSIARARILRDDDSM